MSFNVLQALPAKVLWIAIEVCKTSTPSSNLGAAFFNFYSNKFFVSDDRVLSIDGEGTRVYASGFAVAVYAVVKLIHGDRSGRVG